MSALKARIEADMKTALRAGDKPRLGTIRLILAAIKQREVDERIALDDAQVIVVLDKMQKQRRESITQFEAAGREDLAAQERFESGIIQDYLPTALTEAELSALLDQALAASGASGIKDMGKVMAILKPQIQGRADLGAVSSAIKARLGA